MWSGQPLVKLYIIFLPAIFFTQISHQSWQINTKIHVPGSGHIFNLVAEKTHLLLYDNTSLKNVVIKWWRWNNYWIYRGSILLDQSCQLAGSLPGFFVTGRSQACHASCAEHSSRHIGVREVEGCHLSELITSIVGSEFISRGIQLFQINSTSKIHCWHYVSKGSFKKY